MSIITTRRISQAFFLLVFVWFCIVSSLGERWWQLRGWPVNWIMQLDPLVGLGTLLTTRALYAGLLWGLATVVLTLVLGRFFCGWICPFGAIHQFIGYLGRRHKALPQQVSLNRYHPGQSIKYWILTFLLSMALAQWAADFLLWPRARPWFFAALGLAALALLWIMAARRTLASPTRTAIWLVCAAAVWSLCSLLLNGARWPSASLQIGLLDPIPLLYRSINLIVLPLAGQSGLSFSAASRFYAGSGLIGAVFVAAVLLNLKTPRFYCRYVCPLGALLGVLSRYSLWRIGKTGQACRDCHLCEKNCEGACEPTAQIRISECVLCLNCLGDCRHNLMSYQTTVSAAGEIVSPDLSRRALVAALFSGATAIPVLRVGARPGPNWNPALIRPPGALPEEAFLSRCIKCGQCMRICPTNVIHPAGLEGGLEGLWTPALNFRIGTSGCQFNCTACGNLCPTAAIRPITLEERRGLDRFADRGPIKVGTAFMDRGRCLPWAMDRPCIVCQENCPVSPKAIFTREFFSPVHGLGELAVATAGGFEIELERDALPQDRYATGDYYCRWRQSADGRLRRIVSHTARRIRIAEDLAFNSPPYRGSGIDILIRLQQPHVDPELCIGCGVCEHECPVPGKRAIRVTAENESRNRKHVLLLQG